MMLGWASVCARRASRCSATIESGCCLKSSFSTLMATYGLRSCASCLMRSSALKTTPMPPLSPPATMLSSTNRPFSTLPSEICGLEVNGADGGGFEGGGVEGGAEAIGGGGGGGGGGGSACVGGGGLGTGGG